MKYYIGSASLVEDVFYEESIQVRGMMGGGGIYALVGASLWTNEVNLVSAMSKQYIKRVEKWFKNNNLSMENINVVEDSHPVNQIKYSKDGLKKEVHLFEKEHFKLFDYTLNSFLEHSMEDCGIYLFRNASKEFWEPFVNKKNKKAKVLWRVAHDACQPQYIPRIMNISNNVDIIAITYTDAQHLYNTEQYNEILYHLKQLKSPLILLLNIEGGMLFIKNGVDFFIPYYTDTVIVDRTGGGSGASAAVLVGYCQGKSILEMGYMANHSRIFCIEQFGLPDSVKEYRNRNFIDMF